MRLQTCSEARPWASFGVLPFLYTIVASTLSGAMPANWIWIQVAIVAFVLIGMIVAIVKLV
jgi:hypothetical protein